MAGMRPGILIILVGATQTGCLSAAPSQGLRAGEDIRELPILWQRSGHDDRIKRPFHYLALDAKALARVPLAEVPVDFKNQMVLIAAAGPVRSPEVQIRIQRLWKAGPRIRARVEIIHPPDREKHARRGYSPYHIVVVPKSDLNVEGFSSSLPQGAFQSPGAG